jgi:hypothetical protein
MAYIPQAINIAKFIGMVKAKEALITGAASPYRLNEKIAKMLSDNPGGLEAELISVSDTMRGGYWQNDEKTNSGFIGNFQCRIKVGDETTFANLSAADVIQFIRSADKKQVVKLETTKNKVAGKPDYQNIRCVSIITLDASDEQTIKSLEDVAKFAKETANVTV